MFAKTKLCINGRKLEKLLKNSDKDIELLETKGETSKKRKTAAKIAK